MVRFKKKLLSSLLVALSVSLFTPAKTTVHAAELQQPDIVGKYAVTLDYDTGEIIYAKGIDDKAYPASTTKVMTGLLFAENAKKTDSLPYTADAKNQQPYTLNGSFGPIPVGESMNNNDLMKALLMFSANDAAYVIADGVAGNAEKFSDMMNQKVKELGLKNTHFVTPNGLHRDNHYTTAYDIAVILRNAFKNPWIKETMGLKESTITINGKKVILHNRNKDLGIDGNIGGKTGFTTPAGRCLVTVYERNGRKIVGAVLDSQYDAKDETVFNDMNKIMNYSYDVKEVPYIKANTTVDTIPVQYKLFRWFGPKKTIDVPFNSTQNINYYDNTVNKKETTKSIDLKGMNAWQIASNPEAAHVTVSQRAYSKNYPVQAEISTFTLIKANLLSYFGILVLIVVVIVLILLLIRTINLRRRRKRRRRIF
ncbi:D-alanyl-D-alanine carboxypeptidase family protein [Clostridium sp.]|uniref:D-alanyl-D-alanine carboxypeptidase family protein n=1 Tax=Clostridium sp. TaxID=1506 RepID=UPI00262EC04C|nr:D-alanyl-D-alanine carboxypeptidase family protein [Clostridium sp.]